MKGWLAVAAGGALGSAARYGAGLLALRLLGNGFPYGTLAVNVGGCLGIGLGAGWMQGRGLHHEGFWLFAVTGFLGGFTTFSAFGLESFQLLAGGHPAKALLCVAANLSGGLLAVWGGMSLGKRF